VHRVTRRAIVVPIVRVPRAIPAAVALYTLAYPHKQSPGLANRKKNNFDRNSRDLTPVRYRSSEPPSLDPAHDTRNLLPISRYPHLSDKLSPKQNGRYALKGQQQCSEK